MKKSAMILVILLTFLSGCSFTEKILIPDDFSGKLTTEVIYHPPPSRMTLGMVGDILLHHPLYTYDDYAYSFAEVKASMESIDFLLANQESMPAGDIFDYSGYPTFNSPAHIIKGLQDAGVDMVSIANNHTLDHGEKGTLAAIENIKSHGMPYVGAYTSSGDQEEPRVFTVNNITIGFLAYTYGTNGLPTPEGKDYLVARMDPARISREVKAMKKLVDVAVVSMHWGNEYELSPNQTQKDLAQVIADAGGDIIFGHHPHVLQPFDLLEGVNGNPTHVFYSLGNFFSGQKFEYTDIGGIARLTVEKDSSNADSPITISQPSFFPTAVVKDANEVFRVVPLIAVEQEKIVSNDWVIEHMNTALFAE